MKKICAAILAIGLVVGPAGADPRIDRGTIVVSTMEDARDDNWAGVALTLIVFSLIFIGGSGAGAVVPN